MRNESGILQNQCPTQKRNHSYEVKEVAKYSCLFIIHMKNALNSNLKICVEIGTPL